MDFRFQHSAAHWAASFRNLGILGNIEGFKGGVKDGARRTGPTAGAPEPFFLYYNASRRLQKRKNGVGTEKTSVFFRRERGDAAFFGRFRRVFREIWRSATPPACFLSRSRLK
jgi:hypothetical protein